MASVGYAQGISSTGLAVVAPGSGGKITIAAAGGTTAVRVAAVGYDPLTGTPGSVFVPVAATRIASSATGVGLPKKPVAAGSPAAVTVTGTSVVPRSGASAVLLEVTASGATRSATVTVYPSGAKKPAVTSLSVGQGGAATGLVPVVPGSGGRVSLAVSAGRASLAVDEVGYYRPDSPPPAVNSLAVTRTTTSSVLLSWANPAPAGRSASGLADVVIRRSAGSAPPATITSGSAVATVIRGTVRYTDSGLTAGTAYAYALFARDSIGNPAKPATVLAMTAAGSLPPCTDTFTGATSRDWDDPANWNTGAVPGASDWACVPTSAAHLPADISGPQTVTGFTNQGGLEVDGSLRAVGTAQASASLGTLTVSGTLAGMVTVTGDLVLSGTVQGPGTVRIDGGGALDVSDESSIATRGSLVNNGSATFAYSAVLDVAAGASFTNAGQLRMNAGAWLKADGGIGSQKSGTIAAVAGGSLVNTRTITAAASNSDPVTLGAAMGIDDKGTITVPSGTLDLNGAPPSTDSSDTGTVLTTPTVIESGATLTVPLRAMLFVTGSVTVASGATFAPPGPVTVNDALTLDQATTFATLTVAGTLANAAAVEVSGTLTLNDGFSFARLAGPGTVTVDPGGALVSGYQSDPSAEEALVSGGALVNEGTGTVQTNATLDVGAGASFANAGTMTLAGAAQLSTDCGDAAQQGASGTTPAVPAGVVTSTGTITVASAPDSPALLGGCAGLDDQGTVTVATGTLDLDGSPPLNDATDTGTVPRAPATIDSGARLAVDGGASLDITGDTVIASGGTLSASGPVTVDGPLTLDQAVDLQALTIGGDNDAHRAASLELGPGIVAHATSTSFGRYSALTLDAAGSGQFGELITGGTVSPANAALHLSTGSYTPDCGTAVTGLAAGSVTGSFAVVSGATPDGGSWQASATSMTAGGYLTCP